MALSITGIFWTVLILVVGFWLGKKYPGMLGGII